MGTSEKFCLRWNDFENNISVAFREIREEKDFFDCTLSCGSRQVQAHKLILSACSPFFRMVLRQNPHQHPLIYLKGVEFVDLQYVLNFMYHGEVNVAQEELNTFLAVAEDLQVKGLTQNDKDCNNPSEASKPESKSKVQYASSSIKAPSKVSEHQASQRSRQHPVVASCTEPSPSQESEDILELPAVKQEPQPMVSYPPSGYHDDRSQVANIDDSYVEGGYEDYGEYEDSALYSGSGMTGQGDLSSRGKVLRFVILWANLG